MSGDRVLLALGPVAALFDRLGITWHVGGSVASTTFGTARSTLDVDIAADVRLEHVDAIVAALRVDYYADGDLIRDAVRHRTCFNLLYLRAYFKVDIFVPPDTRYARMAMSRSVRRELRVGDVAAVFPFATPEDVALHKLDWWQQAGGSERQWADLMGLLRAQRGRLDLAYLREWAAALGLTAEIEQALHEAM
ncbi:MAG: hypothetical protein JNN13_15255 [Planctomycetes bacterium]|nr:hypothetical protein [Planctomycetota bacterium]